MLENTQDDQPAAEAAEGAATDTSATDSSSTEVTKKATAKKATAKKATAKKAAATKTAKKATAKKTAAKKTAATKTAKKAGAAATAEVLEESPAVAPETPDTPEVKTRPATSRSRKAAVSGATAGLDGDAVSPASEPATGSESKPARKKSTKKKSSKTKSPKTESGSAPEADDATEVATALVFQPPEQTAAPSRKRGRAGDDPATGTPPEASAEAGDEAQSDAQEDGDDPEGGSGAARRRRRRGGRRRRKSGDSSAAAEESTENQSDEASEERDEESTGEGTTRRRRRRRRAGESGGENGDDPQNTVTRVRKGRPAEDQITAMSGSTRLEAKKQRRREGREAGRRRAPIVSEAEFLARRESVERVMVIRQIQDVIQIAVLEDKVLVEHYVARESQTSLIGNVYLGRVQNVLPSMEAAFIDIGKGRNAVLYAGEVNWSALGHPEGQPRKIESVLSSGQSVMVQVTKDPVGHKGARLTSQISLAGRFLVYVPDGTTSGISRKLPDTERNRLKTLLKDIVPDSAGVIVRTAAEGASEEELTRDVERLKARWEDIERKSKGGAPQLLYGEPDLTLKVVRDLFTEDFTSLVIQGDDAWDTVQAYVTHVAADLEERLKRYDVPESGADVFAAYRIDEQIAKGLDRKVWLPSGGSLVIDRTEAMTVVDVNTGKFTGSGGNLEETVTKNNLEAAEEMVRQLRLRDIGGIIVIDFIDMVLESNRDLVLRRLVECLGRDRTRHQVAEVTSLGLVQMTRKRIGTGLLEAFSEPCEHCGGRGLRQLDAPVEPKRPEDESRRGGRRSRGGRGRAEPAPAKPSVPSPKDVAAAAKAAENSEPRAPADDPSQPATPATPEEHLALGPDEPTTPLEESSAAPEESATVVPATPEPEGEVEPPTASEAEQPVQTSAGPPVEAPEPVTVVTRTRRRSASRPAGPPSSEASSSASNSENPAQPGGIGAPAGSTDPDPGTPQVEPVHDAEAPVVEHVPVKKRGARKR